MERVLLEHVWKQYDRRYGSNRFRKLFASLMGRHPERNEFWALQDISFQLEEGESLGIIGPNGSGKTTLLRLLSGISRINRGHLLVRGTVSALIALGAGFHPELSGRENIYLNGSILGLKHRMIRKFFDDIVEFADIGEYIDSPVKRYSSGMFVRLGFAVAAQVRPDILLVDEVLAVGDARFQARCHERIAQLRESGTIIILVSHDLWAVRQSCQQGLYIDHGHIHTQGDIATVLAAYNKQIQQEALLRLPKVNESENSSDYCSCDLDFLDEEGQPVTEIPLGAPATLRLYYRCDEPIPSPTLVVNFMAHNGPCASILRSRKAGWQVEKLEGEGHLDVQIPNLRLNPGQYAVSVQIKDTSDRITLVKSRFRELFIKTPHLDWCYENCYYIPDARWSEPVPHHSETNHKTHFPPSSPGS